MVVDVASGGYCQHRRVFSTLFWQVVPLGGYLGSAALPKVIGTQDCQLVVVQVERQVHGCTIDTFGAADAAGGSIGDLFAAVLRVGGRVRITRLSTQRPVRAGACLG